jgi:hypothetical protein
MPLINNPSDANFQDHGSIGHNTRFREPREFSDLLMRDFRWSFGTESAGISRHIVGDERALRRRRSDSILASSIACDLARDHSEASTEEMAGGMVEGAVSDIDICGRERNSLDHLQSVLNNNRATLPSDRPADDAWKKHRAWKSLARFPHPQAGGCYGFLLPARSLLVKKEMAPRSNRRSVNLLSVKVFARPRT